MSNSPLVVYTKLSPNHSGKRTKKIDTITIHCMAGNCSVETCGNLFAKLCAAGVQQLRHRHRRPDRPVRRRGKPLVVHLVQRQRPAGRHHRSRQQRRRA